MDKQTQKIVEELQVELAKHSPILTMRDGAIVDGTDCVWCSSSPCPVTFPCELSVKLSAAISRLQELDKDAKRWRAFRSRSVVAADVDTFVLKAFINKSPGLPTSTWEDMADACADRLAALSEEQTPDAIDDASQETPRGDEPRK